MKTQQRQLIKAHPLSPTLGKRFADACNGLADPLYSPSQAEDVLADVFLPDADAGQVKVYAGRAQSEDIRGFLREIESKVIVRTAEWLVQGACGERWSKIGNGHAYSMLIWLGNVFPIVKLAMGKMEELRGKMRAEKVLDRLDALSEEAENEGARVKACEILLRAHHPAFGHATEAKKGSDRPMVVVNIANILGEGESGSVSNASAMVIGSD